jgi:crossover junction endodeoxyribonuclease RuvC
MNYFGIDPGKTGGVALITALFTKVWPMPIKDKEVDCRELKEILSSVKVATVFIEKVHAMPGQGVTSMFNFGQGYGKIKGCLEAMGMEYQLVTPQAWKKLVLEGMDWKKRKVASVEYCQDHYPDISLLRTPRCKKPHDGLSDALCIAEYGRITG